MNTGSKYIIDCVLFVQNRTAFEIKFPNSINSLRYINVFSNTKSPAYATH